MTRKNNTTVDELLEAAARRFPELSTEEQRAGIGLLHELASGEPVTIAQLAQALGISAGVAEALVRESTLSPFVHTDKEGRIVGFDGLAVAPTHHQLTVNGRTLWTWCAPDTLFMPELLGDTAEIDSRDPETDQPVRLTGSPDRVEAVEPKGIVVSVMAPKAWELTSADRIMASACHFMFFFASRASGERWVAKHPETVLVSLEEAFVFGKRRNARMYGAELARRRASAA